jgi:hypothetical protein
MHSRRGTKRPSRMDVPTATVHGAAAQKLSASSKHERGCIPSSTSHRKFAIEVQHPLLVPAFGPEARSLFSQACHSRGWNASIIISEAWRTSIHTFTGLECKCCYLRRPGMLASLSSEMCRGSKGRSRMCHPFHAHDVLSHHPSKMCMEREEEKHN